MTIHEEKKFICDLCGKTFCSKSRTKNHFRRSHCHIWLVCTFCGKKYRNHRPDLLKLHELDHQNIRHHPCEICTKPYTTAIFKMEHIRNVHFKSKIKCELCGKCFLRPGIYRNHVKSIHGNLGAERIEELVARINNIRPDYDKLEWVYA